MLTFDDTTARVPAPRDARPRAVATLDAVARLRLFASAREAAGTGDDVVPGRTIDEVLATAVDRYGSTFGDVLKTSRVWLNGEFAEPSAAVADDDEVAVLPPVSGGSR